MADTVKVGPWGAPDGYPGDINVGSRPQRLETITISWDSGNDRIIGFSFVYVDQNRQHFTGGPWGRIDPEHTKTIQMTPDELLHLVSGTFDRSTGVTSLMLITNKSRYGPYGSEAGSAFSVPLTPGRAEVVAFFGRFNDTLMALGVYVLGKKGLPLKIGPWGGSVGKPVDIINVNTLVQLKSVTVSSTQRIDGFSFTYVDQNGNSIDVGPWGTTGESPHKFSMSPGEYVNNITGTFDEKGVTWLKFTTNQSEYGPFGSQAGSAFSVPLPDDSKADGRDDNGAVVGFFGRSGGSLVALGVYVGPAPNEP